MINHETSFVRRFTVTASSVAVKKSKQHMATELQAIAMCNMRPFE